MCSRIIKNALNAEDRRITSPENDFATYDFVKE
jgi:hypothetical protein